MDALTFAIEPRPRVVEPALNRLEPVAAVGANRGGPVRTLERNVMRREIAFELRIVRVRRRGVSPSGTHSVHGACRTLRLVVFAADREDVGRVVELRLQRRGCSCRSARRR